MSKTRYEWTLLNYAIWAAGCVTAPIYQTSSADQVELILADSSAKAVVVETSVQYSMVNEIQQRLPELSNVWQVESRPVDEPGAVTKLIGLGRQVPDEEVHIRRQAITADNTAALIYTSGTTGPPKGRAITHRNFLAEAYADYAGFPHLLQRGASILMFLPMAHVMAYSITVTCVYFGVIVGHTADLERLAQTLRLFDPPGCPRYRGYARRFTTLRMTKPAPG